MIITQYNHRYYTLRTGLEANHVRQLDVYFALAQNILAGFFRGKEIGAWRILFSVLGEHLVVQTVENCLVLLFICE